MYATNSISNKQIYDQSSKPIVIVLQLFNNKLVKFISVKFLFNFCHAIANTK